MVGMAARRAVAMGISQSERAPWRSRAIQKVTEDHERWVRLNPMTAEEIMEFLRMVSKAHPLFVRYGIQIDTLIIPSTEDMRAAMETIRDWAEKAAFALEPHVMEKKPGLATPYADMHVLTYGVDRWLERFDSQQEEGI